MARHSFTVGTLRHLSLACALVCASIGAAHAGSVSLAQASGSIRNLRVQLIDLDPNDDITPGIVFNGWVDGQQPSIGAWGQADYQGAVMSIPYANGIDLVGGPASILPTETQQVTSLDGLASMTASPTSLQSSLELQQSDLSRLLPADASYFGNRQSLTVVGESRLGNFARLPTYTPQLGGSYGFHSPGASPTVDGEVTFTLTPNTRMVVTADLSAAASLDSSLLPEGWVAAAQASPDDFYLNGSGVLAQAQLTLSQAQSTMELPPSYPDLGSLMAAINAGYQWSQSYLIAGDNILHTGEYAALEQTSARLVLDNTGAKEMLGAMAVYTGSSVSFLGPLQEPASPLPGDLQPAIPEPSTYALMGLGLVGLALAKRRARRA